MNIFWQELKLYRRVTIIWIVILCFMVYGFLSIFKSFSMDVTQAKNLLAGYPPQVLAALNLQISIFFTIYGFFAYLLTFAWLLGAIQAMNLGVGILSKEISGKTADFLLSKPITRFRMLTEKIGAALVLIVITDIFYLLVSLISAQVFSFGNFDQKIFLMVAGTMFFVQIFFLAIGFLIGALAPKIKTVVAVTLPTVFGFFIISAFGSVIKDAHLEYFTPFKYFNAIYIVQNSAYEPKFLWILVGVVIVSIVTSYIFYIKKDIEAVT